MLRARIALSVGLWLAAGLACNSDDPGGAADASSTGPQPTTGADPTTSTGAGTSTGAPTTGTGTSTGVATTATTGEETTGGPPEQTCRDVLTCVSKCALTLDPACFQMCTEGLSPEEGMKAIALGGCIAQGCFMSGACSLDTLQDPLCLACIGLGILGKNPEGCEAEADACQ